MPEPNLPPIRLSYDPAESEGNTSVINIASIRKRLKELPSNTRKSLVKKYGIIMQSAMAIVVSLLLPFCITVSYLI